MQKINLTLTSFITAICFLTSCSSWHKSNLDTVDTGNLSQLERVQVEPITSSARKADIGAMREKALKDIAMGVGAQAGLAFASKGINANMEKDRKYLDTIFNFSGMMLSHGVLPPVLEEGDNTLNVDNDTTIRVSDRTYKIVMQARFASTPPNWREYLLLNYTKPPLPDQSLLPRNKAEQAVWQNAIRTGWDRGIQQAYDIFQQNLARLKRDYQGMALYRKLLQQKMVSPPFVARTELGITGDGTNMNVNDQVLRIVELPQLQTNGKHWNAVVVQK